MICLHKNYKQKEEEELEKKSSPDASGGYPEMGGIREQRGGMKDDELFAGLHDGLILA